MARLFYKAFSFANIHYHEHNSLAHSPSKKHISAFVLFSVLLSGVAQAQCPEGYIESQNLVAMVIFLKAAVTFNQSIIVPAIYTLKVPIK